MEFFPVAGDGLKLMIGKLLADAFFFKDSIASVADYIQAGSYSLILLKNFVLSVGMINFSLVRI